MVEYLLISSNQDILKILEVLSLELFSNEIIILDYSPME
jgi:hypothetical protein